MDKQDQAAEMEQMLATAKRQHDQLLADIKKYAEWVQDDMARTIEQAELAQAGKPYAINDLGVIQGAGDDLNRACALLRQKSEEIAMWKYAIKVVTDKEVA